MVNTTDTDGTKLTSYLDLQAQKLRVDLQAARLFCRDNGHAMLLRMPVRRFLQSICPRGIQ